VANAIASLVEDSQLKENYIIPKVNDPRILPVVTQTLKDAILRHIKKDSSSLIVNG
jgi:malate dehydrogenase (oxaloacetate-decarboxylating)